MANVDNAFGLKPVRNLKDVPTERFYTTDSTRIGIGDAVDLAGSASATGFATVTRASVGAPILGVVISVEPETFDSLRYKAASTNRYVNVCTDPDMIYEIQSAGTVAVTDVGLCADLDTIGDANTTTGRSIMEISGTMATGTAQLKILGISNRPDNAVGANCIVYVKINEHRLANAIDGV